MSHRIVAAFDFDKTITHRDTLLPFLLHLHPFRDKFSRLVKLFPVLVLYKLGLMGNQTAKEKLLKAFLKNQDYKNLIAQAKRFSEFRLPYFLDPVAIKRLHWHQKQGHDCFLVSAGLEIYLKPWADEMGLTVSATRLNVHHGKVTGKIDGRNCFGQEKVNRLLEQYGPKSGFELYAYGDSRGDRELLALADHAFYRKMPS